MSSSDALVAHTTNGITEHLAYISSLNLEEIAALQAQQIYLKSPRPLQFLNDRQLAMAHFAYEAEGLLNIARDRRYGGDDVSAQDLLAELQEQEDSARYDRLVAIAIATDMPIPPRPEPRSLQRRVRFSLTPEQSVRASR